MSPVPNGTAPPPPRWVCRLDVVIREAPNAEAAAQLVCEHLRAGEAFEIQVADLALGTTDAFRIDAVEPLSAVEASEMRQTAGEFIAFTQQVGLQVATEHAPLLQHLLHKLTKAVARKPLIYLPG